MEETLQFIVMIDARLAVSDLVDRLVARLPDAVTRKRNSFDFGGNWFEIHVNSDADADAAAGDDGYLYFRYRMEATPQSSALTLDMQVDVARTVCNRLLSCDATIVLCANFENELPQFGPE